MTERTPTIERAADAYAQAKAEYERALAVTAPQPSTETITDARDAVEAEYTELLSAPVDAAQVAASAARATTDPAERAEHWEDALDRYRTACELDWGRDRRFDGGRASLRQALADIAVELVDTHREAGRQALREAGDDSERGAPATACEDAEAHFERAREVATELAPDRRDPAVGGTGCPVRTGSQYRVSAERSVIVYRRGVGFRYALWYHLNGENRT